MRVFKITPQHSALITQHCNPQGSRLIPCCQSLQALEETLTLAPCLRTIRINFTYGMRI